MQQLYHSTRSQNEFVTTKQAILKGIADDGGLYVLDNIEDNPVDLQEIKSNNFSKNALAALVRLLPGFDTDYLKRSIHDAYKSFATKAVCPVSSFGDDYLLELYHGPTCAFKDVALQILPYLMQYSRPSEGNKIQILTATSGDTGKAALDGFADIEDHAVTVFYPEDGVSDVQRLQMVTQVGENVRVCAIKGNFDDAQSGVKKLFQDMELKRDLDACDISLSSANSINIGRLAPQVSYYLDSYTQLLQAGSIYAGQSVEFIVPTGNFGDIFAGYLAKKMGLPVDRLIVASNTNNVLYDFIKTGIYDRRRDFHKTISPSMDILISSNLERLLYYVSDKDVELIAHFMKELQENGVYNVGSAILSKIQETFDAGYANDDMTRQAIRDAYTTKERLIDPHTAVAAHVASTIERFADKRIILSTANPYKFSHDVLCAISPKDAELSQNGFKSMYLLYGNSGMSVPTPLAKLRSKEIRHKDTITPDEMRDYVLHSAKQMLD